MTGLIRFVIRRLLLLVPTVLVILTVIFLLLNVLPGDAAVMYVGLEKLDPQGMAMLRQKMGLDTPVPSRYLNWVWGVFHGNLGQSLITGIPVEVLLAQRIPYTLLIVATTMFLAVCIAVPTGILSALKRNTKFDFLATGAVLVGVSMPTFWLGIILILVFSVMLGWLPSAAFDLSRMQVDPLGTLSHLVLPSLTLAGWSAANLARIVRSSMLEVMGQDYITALRSKGLAERTVIFKHALRNAMIPVVTVLGLQTASLLGGAVVTEIVFGIPGIGTLIYTSVLNRDYTVLQGVLLFVGVLLVFLNLIVDVGCAFLDPRISLR
jgi:peptide/nickel transport system permease protein